LGITGNSEDGLLGEMITSAESYIDTSTHRHFRIRQVTWRHFHAENDVDVDENMLFLDYDLVKDYEIINGDGSIVPVAHRFLHPANRPPYWGIRLDHTLFWTWEDTPINAIRVNGLWGYSEKAPTDIVQATRRLAAYLYKQKDSQVFETASFFEGGILTIPEGVPAFVQQVIDKYTRQGVA